jgi:hypothetical protein
MSRKLVSAALAVSTLVWAVGVAALPVASAQSTTSVQAQITALLAQIAQLQAHLGTSSTATATASYSFTKDLTLGSKGADVTALQQLLISKGDLTAVTAPTGYFGTLTQSALAAFQSANGITPAAGYFGPKTRAFVNSMSVSTTTTTTKTTTQTTTTGTNTTGAQTTSGVTAPASGILVSVASSNPATGSLISSQGTGYGAARVPVLAVNFTAGTSGGVTVSEVKFHKVGVLSDSSVSGAYLTQNGKVLYQYNSLNQGVLDFSGLSLNVPAGQTVTLTLAIDVSGGLSSGNTVSFSLNSASDVSAFDVSNNALTPAGIFPVNGNMFTVTTVSNPALASVEIEFSSVGNQVTAGTQGNLVGAWTFTPQNSKVYLDGLNFHVIGSANKGDIRNVKLMVNGTQVGATLATVGADGTAYFNASATPGVLNTGSNNVQVFADIMGSPSYNFQFEILNGYDVNAVDSQYNVPVATYSQNGMNSATAVTIQQGQITVTQDANTPTGNIAKGQSSITLAKFDVYAAGEAVKVQYLPFQLNLVQNISIVDDAGGQVGTTINQPPSTNSLMSAVGTDGLTDTAGALTGNGTLTYNDSFGSSGSPINYTIPANTTRVLSLRADIESLANFATVTGNLLAPAGGATNLQGMISSKSGSTSGANGSALSLAQSSLVVTANNALGNQSVAAGVANLKIGSYSFAASSAEGVNVNNVSIILSPNGASLTASQVFQNLKLMVNGTQLGTTAGTLNQVGTYTFSGTPFDVPAGTTVNVDVYADTLSSATSTYATQYTPSTELSAFTGTGTVSNSAISLVPNTPVQGQSLYFRGSALMSVAADSSEPAATTLTMGSMGNTLAVYRFQETSNIEPVKVTDLTVTDVATTTTGLASLPAFNNLKLWSGTTLLGTAGSAVSTSGLACPAGESTSTAAVLFSTPTSTFHVSFSATTTANETYSYLLTIGTKTYPTPGSVSLLTASTTGDDNATTSASIVAYLNANSWYYGVTAATAGASSTPVINVTSTAVANPLPAISPIAISGSDPLVTLAVNNSYAGQASAAKGALTCLVPLTASAANGTYSYSFHFANPIIVPQGNTSLVTLKGDVGSYLGNGATDNSSHVFSLVSSTVTALGQTSNQPTNVSGSGSGNSMEVLRSMMTVATAPSSFTQNGKQPFQQVGSVTLTANNAGPVMLKSLNLNFSGGNVTGTNLLAFTNSVVLKGPNSVDVTASTTGSGMGAWTSTSSAGTASTTLWTFATSTTANTASSTLVVSPGSPVTLQLWGNTAAISGITNIAESLSVTIQSTADVAYLDSTDGTGTPLNLPVNAVPLTVSSFSWASGQ